MNGGTMVNDAVAGVYLINIFKNKINKNQITEFYVVWYTRGGRSETRKNEHIINKNNYILRYLYNLIFPDRKSVDKGS